MQSTAKIFSGTGSLQLAEQICKKYGTKLGNVNIQHFSDGEIYPVFNESVRGDYVFLIQSTHSPTDNLMELLLMIDAACRASAYKVIAVLPYYGYARQDRKDRPRVAIGSKLVANMLVAAGADRIITMDLHAPQIQGYFDIPVDHLDSSAVFIPYIEQLKVENLTNGGISYEKEIATTTANAWEELTFDFTPINTANSYQKVVLIFDLGTMGDGSANFTYLFDDIRQL